MPIPQEKDIHCPSAKGFDSIDLTLGVLHGVDFVRKGYSIHEPIAGFDSIDFILGVHSRVSIP